MKRALAEILWEAANVRLSPTDFYSASCCAAYLAEFGKNWFASGKQWHQAAEESKAVEFLRALGCPVFSDLAFRHFSRGETRQGARYLWLLLAMHVAADENIMVEA